jgi:hypothetical protein
MTHMDTTDFFTRLEAELRRAAEHPAPTWRRRLPAPGAALAVAAVAGALALALVPLLAVLGGGGAAPQAPAWRPSPSEPPRVGEVVQRDGDTRTVVATGSTPVGGPWQLEAYTGSEAEPCLNVVLRDEGIDHGQGGWGGCGDDPRTPGFARLQHSLPNAPGAGPVREVLVYGRVPQAASAVVITVDGEIRERVRPFDGPPGVRGDFYLVAIPPDLTSGRVNWLDGNGRAGSGGIELLPP